MCSYNYSFKMHVVECLMRVSEHCDNKSNVVRHTSQIVFTTAMISTSFVMSECCVSKQVRIGS